MSFNTPNGGISSSVKLKPFFLNLFGAGFILAAAAFSGTNATSAYGQNRCSKSGPSMRFAFQNATLKDIEVRLVLTNCNETPGRVIKPGEQVGGNSSANNVFRVYEADSNRFITEVMLEASQSVYKIENCSRPEGDEFAVAIRNAAKYEVEIRRVSRGCTEESGATIEPEMEYKTISTAHDVYRIYRKSSGILLREIVIEPSTKSYKVENCSQAGAPRLAYIRNSTGREIEIHRVAEDCRETPGAVVGTGKQFEINTYANNVFRIYDKGASTFLDEFVIEADKSTYIVKPVENDTPASGFLETANIIRKSRNLPTLAADEKLTNACQWFAEFMANEDQNRPGHTVREFRSDNPHPDRNTTLQRLAFFGWDKKNSVHFEATALDTIPDINVLGGHFALLWSSGTTHHKPFYEGKFKQAGFGYAKAKSGTIKYYACALFANR